MLPAVGGRKLRILGREQTHISYAHWLFARGGLDHFISLENHQKEHSVCGVLVHGLPFGMKKGSGD